MKITPDTRQVNGESRPASGLSLNTRPMSMGFKYIHEPSDTQPEACSRGKVWKSHFSVAFNYIFNYITIHIFGIQPPPDFEAAALKDTRRLTEAEWEIMQGVWAFEGAPASARDIHRRLYPEGQKAYPTVQTILSILAEKGFVRKNLVGMVNFFTPTVTREEIGERETRTLVSRAYGGSFGALAHHLVNSGELSRNDLMRLKAMIEELGQEQGRT